MLGCWVASCLDCVVGSWSVEWSECWVELGCCVVVLLCGWVFGLLGCWVVSCLECFVGSFACLPMASQRPGWVVGVVGVVGVSDCLVSWVVWLR